MPVVHSSASVFSTEGVLSGHGPSSNVSTTSLSRRKSSCLKCSKPKPGPPVVSISTTRAVPSALGLPAQAGAGGEAGAGVAAAGTGVAGTDAGAAAGAGACATTGPGGRAVSAGATVRVTVRLGAVGGLVDAGAGAGVPAGIKLATVPFWANTIPKTAKNTAIAIAQAAAARRRRIALSKPLRRY